MYLSVLTNLQAAALLELVIDFIFSLGDCEPYAWFVDSSKLLYIRHHLHPHCSQFKIIGNDFTEKCKGETHKLIGLSLSWITVNLSRIWFYIGYICEVYRVNKTRHHTYSVLRHLCSLAFWQLTTVSRNKVHVLGILSQKWKENKIKVAFYYVTEWLLKRVTEALHFNYSIFHLQNGDVSNVS